MLDVGLANVLVNDPTADLTNQDTQSETTLVLGAHSRVIVAYNDSDRWVPRVPVSPALHFTGYSRSTDGGGSFADKGSLPEDPGGVYVDEGDPVLARSSRTGTVFLATVTVGLNPISQPADRINVYRSVNDGGTFQVPRSGTPGFAPGVDRQDKPWMVVDNFPGPGFGNVYLAWNDLSADPANNALFVTRSTDDGLTWGPAGGTRIASAGPPGFANAFGGWVTVGPDHAVYVFWWSQDGPRILMRGSTDRGLTFGAARTVALVGTHGFLFDLGLTDAGGAPFRSNTTVQAAVNPVTGDIYLVYQDQPKGPSTDRGDIVFVQSTDGGETWSEPRRVNDDATRNDQWHPALAVTPDGGHVGIFWYDRRLDPANDLIDRFGVIGRVSGAGVDFGANFRITDVSYPPYFGQDPAVAPTYMDGDYDQAAADDAFFYTTWGDNRLANPNDPAHTHQSDVRLAEIPVAGMTAGAAAFDGSSWSGGPGGPPVPWAEVNQGAPAGVNIHQADILLPRTSPEGTAAVSRFAVVLPDNASAQAGDTGTFLEIGRPRRRRRESSRPPAIDGAPVRP